MLWAKFALLKYAWAIIPDTEVWGINKDQLQHQWQEQVSSENQNFSSGNTVSKNIIYLSAHLCSEQPVTVTACLNYTVTIS